MQDSELRLTRRVLERARTDEYCPFAGSMVLNPTASRYDILDDFRYSADKRCIFLSFPYFAVAKPQAKHSFRRGHPWYSMRTLLRSQYRLDGTSDRDNRTVCPNARRREIRMRDCQTARSCVNASEAEVAQSAVDLFMCQNVGTGA